MSRNKVYRLTAGDKEIFRKAADPSDGVGANWFLSYYFGGREFRPWQWALHHAMQRQLTVVGGTGCASYESRILHPDGTETPIGELAECGLPIWVIAFDGEKYKPTLASPPFKKGEAMLYRLTFDDGTSIEVTEEHRFLVATQSGPTYLSLVSGLAVGQSVYCADPSKIFLLSVSFKKIVSIESVEVKPYYDLHVPLFNNYVIEGTVSHNSGKTVGVGLSIATWAAMTPMFSVMNLAPT